MKSLLLLLAAATASVSLLALGQSASPSPAAAAAVSPSPGAASPSASPGAPEASSVPLPGQPSGPALEKTMPLIPEIAPAGHGKHGTHGTHDGSDAHASPGGSPHGTFDVEQDIRRNIRFRQAETRVSNEPAIQAYWAAAHVPGTDPGRRAALTVYYNHLYDRMIQIDPTIAELANSRRQAAINRMLYVHLGDPAAPIDADPFATPIPDIGGKNPPVTDIPPALP